MNDRLNKNQNKKETLPQIKKSRRSIIVKAALKITP
jgi:hypothetical protein